MATLYKRTFVFSSWYGEAEILIRATQTTVRVTRSSSVTMFRVTHSIKNFHRMVELVQDAIKAASFQVPSVERFLFLVLTHDRFAFEVTIYKLPQTAETE